MPQPSGVIQPSANSKGVSAALSLTMTVPGGMMSSPGLSHCVGSSRATPLRRNGRTVTGRNGRQCGGSYAGLGWDGDAPVQDEGLQHVGGEHHAALGGDLARPRDGCGVRPGLCKELHQQLTLRPQPVDAAPHQRGDGVHAGAASPAGHHGLRSGCLAASRRVLHAAVEQVAKVPGAAVDSGAGRIGWDSGDGRRGRRSRWRGVGLLLS